MTVDRPWEQEPPEPSAASKRKPWIYAAIGLILIGSCSYAISDDTESTGGHGGSELACKQRVRAQLGHEVKFDRIHSRQLDDDSWYVTGSANGTKFICSLTYVSSENYTGTVELF